MKKILCSLIVLGCVSSSYAACTNMYEDKGERRDKRNQVVVAVGTGLSVGLITSPLAPVMALGLIGGGGFLYDSVQHDTNQFEKIHKALLQAEDLNTHGEELRDLYFDTLDVAEKENVSLTMDEMMDILNEANESEAICPLVKIGKNKRSKYAVLNRKSLKQFITQKILLKNLQSNSNSIE